MPSFVRAALEEEGLVDDFYQRPPYQQNDYISWINRAKRPPTRHRRLQQMLDELEMGGVYMNIPHPPSRKP
jgi:uncharacterized protein YdeI (YjbR/CyaY-like superfamily)